MCCKLLAVQELGKEMGEPCPHTLKGRGCGIYERRPQSCRAFNCLWLTTGDMPDYWKPDKCKIVVAGDETGTLVNIIVSAGYEEAWKKQPHYNDIKNWARQRRWRVQVLTPRHGWVIFPEEDLFVGQRRKDDLIVGFGYKQVGISRQPSVTVRHGDGSLTEFVGQLYN